MAKIEPSLMSAAFTDSTLIADASERMAMSSPPSTYSLALWAALSLAVLGLAFGVFAAF